MYVTVTKNDSILTLQFRKSRVITNIVSFCVSNRNSQDTSWSDFVGERTIRRFSTHEDVFADEMQIAIANQRTWQQTGFTQNLKAITNTQNETSSISKLPDGIHHRREASKCAGTKIVTVGKTARDD